MLTLTSSRRFLVGLRPLVTQELHSKDSENVADARKKRTGVVHGLCNPWKEISSDRHFGQRGC